MTAEGEPMCFFKGNSDPQFVNMFNMFHSTSCKFTSR